eukprot:m51a1_g11780 putative peptidyl-prolyl cis-trans isomerase e (138) ;mRNA; f:289141-289631
MTDPAHKRTLYVGGLDDSVDETVLQAAFIPFGDIVDVQIPKDTKTQKARGFGFVTYELEEDAKAAIENMHRAELFGRTLNVNVAKPVAVSSDKPIWQDEAYYRSFEGTAAGAVNPEEAAERPAEPAHPESGSQDTAM